MAVWNVINHTEVGASGVSYYEETSISGSYDHLYLMASIRHDASGSGAYIAQNYLQINGDTASNYSYVRMNSGSTTASSGHVASAGHLAYQYGGAGPSTVADTFAVYELWIPNYTGTTGQMAAQSTWSIPNNSTTDYEWFIGQTGLLWKDTAAVTAIKLYPSSGTDKYDQYSTFTLYGINGAG